MPRLPSYVCHMMHLLLGLQEACPQASSLEVLPHHLACIGIDSLSFSQLEALEVLHHSALAR